jgi:hypothetical protein
MSWPYCKGLTQEEFYKVKDGIRYAYGLLWFTILRGVYDCDLLTPYDGRWDTGTLLGLASLVHLTISKEGSPHDMHSHTYYMMTADLIIKYQLLPDAILSKIFKNISADEACKI